MMKYCPECGHMLVLKLLEAEQKEVPYCQNCQSYRFEPFNTAISLVVLNPDQTKVLLIQQYGKAQNWLVAGYINKGESAEEAAARELEEEVGLHLQTLSFQKTKYWPKTNTLLINYLAVVDSMDVTPNQEVDRFAWFDLKEAYDQVAKGGLAEEFYKYFYERKISHVQNDRL